MDYNSEKGGIIDQDSPRLPIAYGTPDIFSVSGTAASGQIEIARNDLGVFRPSFVASSSLSSSIGADFGTGNLVHAGANLNSVSMYNVRGKWREGAELFNLRKFVDNTEQEEAVFMRMVGDPAAQVGKDWYDLIGEDAPLSVSVSKSGGDLEIGDFFENRADLLGFSSNSFPSVSQYNRSRRPRARMVNYLTAEEAAAGGLEKSILRYHHFSNAGNDYTDLRPVADVLQRVSPEYGRQAHHISQIDITELDGRRCVYGLPVYNLTKKEVTFNASGLENTSGTEGDPNYGMISY
ncbi:MAG: hypothetical protein AAFN92_22745, partial [Bacteroidota bacterium]